MPVNTGFTWTSFFTGGTFILSFFGLITLIIKQIGPWNKQRTDATDKLIEQLTNRLDKVETGRENDRKLHAVQIAKLEARYTAQRALDRHKHANAEAAFDALLLLLKSADNLPAKLLAAIDDVRTKRIRDRDSEKQEAAIIHAAEISAAERAEREFEAEQDK